MRYLSLVEDEARVTHIADDYEVRVDDLQRVIFALGASLEYSLREDDEEIHTDDGYSVIVDVSHRHAVEETISREIDDEDAIDHDRDQLTLAVLRAMGELDADNSGYPVGYSLVVFAEE